MPTTFLTVNGTSTRIAGSTALAEELARAAEELWELRHRLLDPAERGAIDTALARVEAVRAVLDERRHEHIPAPAISN